jgi:streptogramin lyase
MLIRLLVFTVAASTVLTPAPAATITEYHIPRATAFPHHPAVGSNGIVWYTDQNNSFIGRLDPATSKITDVPTPTPASGPHGRVVAPDLSVRYAARERD